MDSEETFRELIETKFRIIEIQIDHTNKRLDGLISNLKWIIGVFVPVITVVLNTLITEALNR